MYFHKQGNFSMKICHNHEHKTLCIDDFTYYIIYKRKKASSRFNHVWHQFRDLMACILCTPCPPTFESFMRKTAFLPPVTTYYFEVPAANNPSSRLVDNGNSQSIGKEFKPELIQNFDYFNENPGTTFRFKQGCDFLIKNLICQEILDRIRIQTTFIKSLTNNNRSNVTSKKRRSLTKNHVDQVYDLAACLIETQRVKFENELIILHCHCNKVDLGLQMPLNIYLSWRLNCKVFSFDYSGYGLSKGKASERNLRLDIMAAYYFLTNTLKIDPENILVFGESLGTVAALHLASKEPKIKGLVLVGVLVSAFRLLFPRMKRNLPIDQLQNFHNISKVQCPTLLIHGALDRIAPVLQVEHFMNLCAKARPSLIIPDGHHDDLMSYPAYWTRLELFIEELGGRIDNENFDYCGMFCPGIKKQMPEL